MNSINLYDLFSLESDPELQTEYVKAAIDWGEEKEFRLDEIESIKTLVSELRLARNDCDNFFYSFSIPQIGKEFDLLKIGSNSVIDIEIKTGNTTEEKIKKQLIQNKYYLHCLGVPCHLFTFVEATNSFFKLEENNLLAATKEEIITTIKENDGLSKSDIDASFSPAQFLVSPLNSPEKFLSGEYFLTPQQEKIKEKVLEECDAETKERHFCGITGIAGTGKTLVLYDIAKSLSNQGEVLIVHCGILCDGHRYLDKKMAHCRIITAKELRLKEIRGYDYVLIDECHRIYPSSLEKVERWVAKAKYFCVISFDKNQTLSQSELNRNACETIKTLCGDAIFSLSKRIRVNPELGAFISNMFDLSKKNPKMAYPHVHLYYASTIDDTKSVVYGLATRQGYQYISITPSLFKASYLDQLKGGINTHEAIGQEFDKVCMVLGRDFQYEDGQLKAMRHPNPDYLFPRLLFQGVTRVRFELALIVLGNTNVMRTLLKIKENASPV